MERVTDAIQFTDDEKEVLADALALKASNATIDCEMLVGDESDAQMVINEAETAHSLFEQFFEMVHGESWEAAQESYNERRDGYLTVHDNSEFDFHEYTYQTRIELNDLRRENKRLKRKLERLEE